MGMNSWLSTICDQSPYLIFFSVRHWNARNGELQGKLATVIAVLFADRAPQMGGQDFKNQAFQWTNRQTTGTRLSLFARSTGYDAAITKDFFLRQLQQKARFFDFIDVAMLRPARYARLPFSFLKQEIRKILLNADAKTIAGENVVPFLNGHEAGHGIALEFFEFLLFGGGSRPSSEVKVLERETPRAVEGPGPAANELFLVAKMGPRTLSPQDIEFATGHFHIENVGTLETHQIIETNTMSEIDSVTHTFFCKLHAVDVTATQIRETSRGSP
jgi:hypothetical protein